VIEVAGWIRNVTDEVYKTLAFDASQAADLVGNFVGDPRTYGVSISFTW
jgi:outer membrane receptor protein involved in Fe transport